MSFRKLAFAIAFLAPASWASIVYTITATYPGTAPSNSLTQPNGTLSITFDLDPSPTPYAFLADQSDVIPQDFVYLLAGSQVSLPSFPSPTAPTMALFPQTSQGGFALVLTMASGDQLGLYFYGPQIFTGPNSAPVLIDPETFTASGSSQWVYFHNHAVAASGNFAQAVVSNAPEPSTLALGGMCAVFVLLRHRFRVPTETGTSN